jgi:hypothetical protein
MFWIEILYLMNSLILTIVSFHVQKLFNLMHSYLLILVLISGATGLLFRK